MYNGQGRLEEKMIALKALIDSGTLSAGELTKALQEYSQLEYRYTKAENDTEEDKQFVEEEGDKMSARQQEFFDKIYGTPEIQALIKQNDNLVENSARNVGFNESKITDIVTNYQSDTLAVRQNAVIDSTIIIDAMKKNDFDVVVVEQITSDNFKEAEECNHKYLQSIDQYFNELSTDLGNKEYESNIEKYKEIYGERLSNDFDAVIEEIGQAKIDANKEFYQNLYKEQLEYSVTELEGDLYRVNFVNNSLNEFKSSDIYKELQNLEDLSPEKRQAVLEKFMSPESIKNLENMGDDKKDYIMQRALENFIDQEIQDLPESNKEKLGNYKEGAQLNGYYLYEQLEEKEIKLSEFIANDKLNLDEKSVALQTAIGKNQEIIASLNGGSIDYEFNIENNQEVYASKTPTTVNETMSEGVDKVQQEKLDGNYQTA